DNGSAYKSHLYAATLTEMRLRHLRIKPRRPRTNGKAERLIQTLLNEWAYTRIYGSSQERTAALPLYLERYNFRRPHGSLSHQPPASRLNNLVRNYRRLADQFRRPKMLRKRRKTLRMSRKIDAASSGASRMSRPRRRRWKSTSVNPAKITRPR